MFTGINIYSINNKTDHISEKYIFIEIWYFPDFRSDLEQDPLFHEMDPRIRIHIKMKRIRNTDYFIWYYLVLGIESISLYDLKGRIKQNQDKLLLSINTNLKVNWFYFHPVRSDIIYFLKQDINGLINLLQAMLC